MLAGGEPGKSPTVAGSQGDLAYPGEVVCHPALCSGWLVPALGSRLLSLARAWHDAQVGSPTVPLESWSWSW
jgi:hypothetical protein